MFYIEIQNRAKQARRDAIRDSARSATPEPTLADVVRGQLEIGHPLAMFVLVGYLMESALPQAFPRPPGDAREPLDLAMFIHNIASWPDEEHTIFLATLAELLVSEDDLRQQCLDALARRADRAPQWLADLSRLEIGRAGRVRETLGDLDRLAFEVRLADGHEMTCVVAIDHLSFDEVSDFAVWSGPIDFVIDNDEPDTAYVPMSPADVRAWIEQGFDRVVVARFAEDRAGCRPIVRWLTSLLPQGGRRYQRPDEDWEAIEAILDTFFDSPAGTEFDWFDERDTLEELIESGTGDPLRWSTYRVEEALRRFPRGLEMDLDTALATPDLLRAFIPVAHALNGIRDELTKQALDAIERARPAFEERVRRELRDEWDRAG